MVLSVVLWTLAIQAVLAVSVFYLLWRWLRDTGRDEPVKGAVFVTGCDSGMGENTAFHLASVGYRVFAGCYLQESRGKYEGVRNVSYIHIDVSSVDSIAAAAAAVEAAINADKSIGGLYGVLQCAGIAYTAPFEYIPLDDFKRQVDVNFFGYVWVLRAFWPLLRKSCTAPGGRRGRVAFVSSGPLPGPGVPFVTSYLAAKWAGEAVVQGLRMECKLRQLPIDCVMVSPGVVKPTRLAEEGAALIEKTFARMPPAAKTEYGDAIECFRTFQIEQPGTHVSEVGRQMEAIMRHGHPHLRYFVGWDAVASVIVGILPQRLKEALLRNSLFLKLQGPPKWNL